MHVQIKFGTDGWRGHIADDFTFGNVALVGSAIRLYLQETGMAEKPLLIGYDRRFAAEAYSAHLACHLQSLGQAVQVFSHACPTPVVAYAVSHLQAAGAVMLTASHNPYHYQGLKFIPWFAGPAMPETTDRITELLRELQPDFVEPRLHLEWHGESLDLREEYFQHLDSLLNNSALGTSGLRILYTAMHGCGAGYVDEYLRRCGMEVEALGLERDVYFGGGLPDPSASRLAPLAQRARDGEFDLVFGTDGDADRFGLLDPQGRWFGANQALPLLADYLMADLGRKGALIRTVATSHLLDGVARLHGAELIETAVGFKYVGDEMRKGALIGGEESGGLSIQGHVPEKDGILATLLMLEMLALRGQSLETLLEELMSRAGQVAYHRIDAHLTEAQKSRLLSTLKDWDADVLAGRLIISRNNIDGYKFVFSDGSWAMFRASGTEPLVRVYVETSTQAELEQSCREIEAEMRRLAGD
ncbi:phosphoglucomutase/phosphomannomutase family protein [bacterium]|nr:phosphoglucomutase/phosphomannomutase family protein [bacterium]